MIKQNFKLTIVILVSVSLLVYSCIKQDFLNPPGTELNENFKLSEARSFFENNATDLRLVDFNHSPITVLETKSSYIQENIVPDWEQATQTCNSNSIMFEIPLNQTSVKTALIVSKKDSAGLQTKRVKAESSLIVQKFTANDAVRYFVVTVIGEYYGKGEINKVNPFRYNGDRRKFNGYMIISDVDGEFQTGYYYANGGRKHISIKPESQNKSASHFTVIRLLKTTLITKGGGYESGEDVFPCDIPGCSGLVENGVCSVCGTHYIGGVIVEDDGTYCPECGNFIGQCICCNICHLYPCECGNPTPCPYCGDPYCNGECQNYSTCTNCGSQLINGVCPNCNGTGGGEGDPPPPPPAQDTMYIISVNVIGSGTVTGDGTFKKGIWTVLNAAQNNSVFGGWIENNSLLSMEILYPLQVISPRCFKALFYGLDTECANLIKKYKTNLGLKSALVALNSKKSINSNIEHAYTMFEFGSLSYFQGTASGVENITFNSIYKYECIVHNHLKTPIPSPQDIIALHKAYQTGSFSQGSYILMQTDEGTMSIEIDNWEQFDSFVTSSFVDKKSIDNFIYAFDKYILNNPTDSELQDRITIDKAINFYTKDKGLKIAYTVSDGTGIDWAYASQYDNQLIFKDCTL